LGISDENNPQASLTRISFSGLRLPARVRRSGGGSGNPEPQKKPAHLGRLNQEPVNQGYQNVKITSRAGAKTNPACAGRLRPCLGGKPDTTFLFSDKVLKGLKDFRHVFMLPGPEKPGFPITGS